MSYAHHWGNQLVESLKVFGINPEVIWAHELYETPGMKEKIQTSLADAQILKELEDEKQFLEKALSCYESDIHKAEDTGNEYFVKLVGDMIQGRKDLETIKTALDKINNFSD